MDWIDVLGLIAGTASTIMVVPQILKIWKTKDAGDVSQRMFIMASIGVALWLVYGIFKQDIALMVTNSVGLLLNVILLILKFRYKKKAAPAG